MDANPAGWRGGDRLRFEALAITKRGGRYLRTLLVHGSRALLRYVGRKRDAKSVWAVNVMQRRHVNVAAVALAAKQARIIWAMLAKGTAYRPSESEAATA